MALVHATSVRNSVANLVVDLIDAGSGAGVIKFYTNGDVLMGTGTFLDPAFAAASAGSAPLSPGAIVATISLAGTNVMAKFKIEDSAANEVFNGTVATSGGDINLTSVTFQQNDSLTINSLTYTAMP
jgi:hypothetical protein